MAVSLATYGDWGRFVDDHNVLVDMNERDRLTGDRDLVPATISPSGYVGDKGSHRPGIIATRLLQYSDHSNM